MKMKMKVPAFIKQITARAKGKSGRRSRRTSDSADNVITAKVGLHDSSGEIGKGGPKHSENLPVAVDTETLSISPGPRRESELGADDDYLFIDLSEACEDDKINSEFEHRDEPSQLLVPTGVLSSRKSVGGQSMSMASLQGMRNTTGQCPFKHGTVYSGPYPGYVHGNPKRAICPNGCKAEMNKVITEDESTVETMMREAMEYLELYYHERNEEMCGTKGFLPKKERMDQVRKAIHETGTYVHTFDELGEAVFFT